MPIDQEGHSVAQDSTNQGLPTMNRWLNVNVRLPLRRTRGFIALPAFDIASAGRTYSEIVGVFNYTSTNNFTLKDYTKITTNGTYTLCIAYANSDSSVVRYVLAKGLHDNNLSYPPTYAGQIIKKNFRLEVWDGTDHVDAVQAATLQMNTSVLSLVVDTRSGVDFELCSASALCTSQNTTNDVQVFTPPATDLELWLKAIPADVDLDGSNNVINWHDRGPRGYVFTQANPATRPSFFADVVPGIGYDMEFIGTQVLISGAITANIVHMFVLLTGNTGAQNSNAILNFSGGTTLSLTGHSSDGGFVTNFNGAFVGATNITGPFNQVVVLEIDTTISGLGLWDGLTSINLYPITNLGAGFSVTPTNIVLGDGLGAANKGFILYGIIGYSAHLSDADRAKVFQYAYYLAAGGDSFNSPLEFAPCTTLTLNT